MATTPVCLVREDLLFWNVSRVCNKPDCRPLIAIRTFSPISNTLDRIRQIRERQSFRAIGITLVRLSVLHGRFRFSEKGRPPYEAGIKLPTLGLQFRKAL